MVVRIGGSGTAEEVFGGMKAVVQGELVGLGELGTGVDWGRVDKVGRSLLLVIKSWPGDQISPTAPIIQ